MSFKNVSAIFIIALVAVSIIACKKCEHKEVAINNEALSWLPILSNQKVVFQNAALQTDSLLIGELTDEIVYDGADECQDHVASRYVYSTFSNHSWRQFNTSIKRNLFSLSVGYGNVQMDVDSKAKIDGTATLAYSTIDTLNGVGYADVMHLTNLNSALQELYYVKTIGLVQYTDSIGVVWNKQ